MSFNRREFIKTGAAGVAGVLGSSGRGFAQVSSGAPGGVQLSIEFSGLCAFAREKSDLRMDTILVDAKKAGLPDRHDPVLVARMSNVQDGSWLPSHVLPGLDGEQMGVWDLTNHHLTIASGGARDRLTFVRTSQANRYSQCPQSREAWRDIGWVADMEKACGQGRIDPACLSDDPRSAPVASRVRLTRGTVESVMPTNPDFRDAIWKFAPQVTETPYEQPLADLVRYTLDTAERIVTLELRPFGEREVKRIGLAASAADASLIAISVSNLPPPVEKHNAGDPIHHFSAFYALLANRPSTRPLPQLARRCDAPQMTKRGAYPILCPPAMLSL